MPRQMVSYAQNFEDVLLRRLFPDVTDGFYVDVGAGHPTADSVTKFFYDLGWSGINLEPNPASHALLTAERPRDLNLNLAASNGWGELPFYECDGSPCWSVHPGYFVEMFGADPTALRRRDVPVLPLSQIFQDHVGRTIDFLKIDAEGHDVAVLEGAALERWRPRVVVVEGTDPQWWAAIFERASYHWATHDGINSYYVRSEDAALLPRLASPVNATDNFELYPLAALRSRLDHVEAQLLEHERRSHEAQARLTPYEGLGPHAIALARGAKQVAGRFPAVSGLVRRLVRVA